MNDEKTSYEIRDYSKEYSKRQWARTVGWGTPDGKCFVDNGQQNDSNNSKSITGEQVQGVLDKDN